MFHLEVQNASSADIPSMEWLTLSARSAYAGEREASAVLRIVDESEAQDLNRDYREKDYATNILSFPSDYSEIPEGFLDEAELGYLGDLVVCADVVLQESTIQKKTVDHHWAHLVIHGMLHLQGYDHINDEDASEMEAIEIELLEKLGVPNPYNETNEG